MAIPREHYYTRKFCWTINEQQDLERFRRWCASRRGVRYTVGPEELTVEGRVHAHVAVEFVGRWSWQLLQQKFGGFWKWRSETEPFEEIEQYVCKTGPPRECWQIDEQLDATATTDVGTKQTSIRSLFHVAGDRDASFLVPSGSVSVNSFVPLSPSVTGDPWYHPVQWPEHYDGMGNATGSAEASDPPRSDKRAPSQNFSYHRTAQQNHSTLLAQAYSLQLKALEVAKLHVVAKMQNLIKEESVYPLSCGKENQQ